MLSRNVCCDLSKHIDISKDNGKTHSCREIVISIKRDFRNSKIQQNLHFYANSKRIDFETRKIFFKDIMEKEIEDFTKMEKDQKDSYIEETMHYNIFFIIYKRMKIIRDSVNKLLGIIDLFSTNLSLSFEKKYLVKFTQVLNVLCNFFKDNKLSVFYDVRCISFLKINSFICKTFKILYPEVVFKKMQKIDEDNQEIIFNFFSQKFVLIYFLLVNVINFI